MVRRLILLEICALGDEVNFISTWHRNMEEDLVIAPPYASANGLLIVLSEEDNGVEKLAKWIEEEHQVQYFNTRPLYIIWEDKKQVHEYAPFENGVRQLTKVHD